MISTHAIPAGVTAFRPHRKFLLMLQECTVILYHAKAQFENHKIALLLKCNQTTVIMPLQIKRGEAVRG